MKHIILTGAPGSGKTSLILALELQGYGVVEEAATDVIAYHQSVGVQEPWKVSTFINDVLKIQKQRQNQARNRNLSVQFYDRSPLCTYALALYLGFDLSASLVEEIEQCIEEQPFEKSVLFIQNLGFIQNTEARRISFEETLKFEKIHWDVYQQFGYVCSTVLPLSLEERVTFIEALV